MTSRQSSPNNRSKVVYAVSHPIQYQAPLFRILAGCQAFSFGALFGCRHGVGATYDPGFGQSVHFGVDVLGGYRYSFAEQATSKPSVSRFWGLRLRDPDRALGAGGKPDLVVLHGWRTAMMWQVARWCRRQRIPYLLRAENPVYLEKPLAKLGTAKRMRCWLVKRCIIAPSAGALVLGSANRRFWTEMGIEQSRQFPMPYFVDEAAVIEAAAAGRSHRAEWRRKWGIRAEDFLIVSSGKLIPRKRPYDLLEAIAGLPPQIVVLWIGTGELEADLHARIKAAGLERRFLVAGFQPAETCWQIIGQADLFAIPAADEWWGLVVNEAVAAGLPVLASDEVAAAEDLVAPGRTGDIVPCGDVTGWRNAILSWYSRIRENGGGFERDLAAELSRRHSLKSAATAFEAAVMAVHAAGVGNS